MKILIIILLSTSIAYAKNIITPEGDDFRIKQGEIELRDLMKSYASVKGYNIQFEATPKARLAVFGQNIVKAENLDLFISGAMYQSGYTFLFLKELNQLKVIASRDVRYMESEVYDDIDKLPRDYNHVKFILPLQYVNGNYVSRNMRPFMSRYGRLISDNLSNKLIISDTAINVHRLYELIKKLDTKSFKERRERIEEINKKKGFVKVKESTSVLSFIKDQHVLFVFVFLLIGLILGYGVRGHMIKKIEGGW